PCACYTPLGAQAAGCPKPARRRRTRALATCATSPFLVLSSLRQPVHLWHPLAQEDAKNLSIRPLLSLFTFPNGRGGGALGTVQKNPVSVVYQHNQPMVSTLICL